MMNNNNNIHTQTVSQNRTEVFYFGEKKITAAQEKIIRQLYGDECVISDQTNRGYCGEIETANDLLNCKLPLSFLFNPTPYLCAKLLSCGVSFYVLEEAESGAARVWKAVNLGSIDIGDLESAIVIPNMTVEVVWERSGDGRVLDLE